MRLERVGLMLLVAVCGMNEARAQTDRPMPGSVPGPPMPGGMGVTPPPFGYMISGSTVAMPNPFGHTISVPNHFSGCLGGMSGCSGIGPNPIGGFCCGPFIGGCGGFGPFNGAVPGGFFGPISGPCGSATPPSPPPQNVHQFYTRWTKTRGKSYFHRSLFVHFPTVDKHYELLLIHYPARRGELYFYDASQRQYIAEYHVGGQSETCFSLVASKERRANLKEIPHSAYGKAGPMPTLQELGMVPSGVWDNAIIHATQLRRPPIGLPDEAVGLPPDEPLDKK